MILAELTKLAARLGYDDPVLEPIRAHVAVRIDAAGCLLRVDELPKGTTFALPRELLRSSDVLPQILWDKPSYVLGVPPKGKHDRRLEQKRAEAVRVHDRLAACSPLDPRLAAAARFLRRDPPDLETADQNYVLFYEDDELPVGSRPEVRDAVREVRMDALRVLGEGTCPVTGERDLLVVDKHPKIKPLPGANSSGGSLVSFDPPSSHGWGLSGFDCLPIGSRAYFGYPTALRWLLQHHRAQLSETSTAVWWTPDGHVLEDLVGGVLLGNHETRVDCVQVLEWTFDELADIELCAAVLAGAQGRASLSWFRKLPGSEVAAALLRHVQRFAPEGADSGYFPSLRRILLCAARVDPRRPLRAVRTPVASDVFAAAVGAGGSYAALSGDAMRELDRRLSASAELDDALDPVRMRAVASSVDDRNGVVTMQEGLDISRTEPPYVLGSLFAVMEEAQRRAIDSVRRNGRAALAARWLREAKQRPARVFPTIQGVCRQHLIKMQKQRRYYYRYLDDLYLNVQAKLDDYPARLSLPEQAVFMLGYDHMRKALRDHMRFKKTNAGDADADAEATEDPAS